MDILANADGFFKRIEQADFLFDKKPYQVLKLA